MNFLLKTIYLVITGILLNLIPTWCAFAEGVTQMENTSGGNSLYAIAAGLAIAIAAFGGALGQARVGAAAMEGIARNPQAQKIMFIPMIIVLALIESFVIFAFAIAMIIAGKI